LTAGRASVFAVLANRDFRKVWTAEVISDVGNFITFIALAVLIHDLTGRTVAVGFALALRAIPWFTLGPIAGVFVDRADRRLVMVVSDLARAGLVTALAFTHTVGQAYLIAFLSGCFGPFFRPARQALLPAIAPGEQYVRALALSQIAHQALHTVGPAIGGAAVAVFGARHAFLFDAGTFLVSAALVVGVSVRGARGRAAGLSQVRRDLIEGTRALRADRVLASLVASRAATVLGEAGIVALLVSYVRDDLARGPAAYGVVLAAGGIGTVMLSYLLARGGSGARRFPWLALAAVSPLLWTLLVFRPGYGALLAIAAVEGSAITGLSLYGDVIMAERTADALRGRLFSLSGASTEAADFAGSLGLAAVGEALGVAPGMAVAGALAAVLGTLALLPGRGRLVADDRARGGPS
jgi:NRE family putative nickel resistance protein-like MFS transporter